MNADTGLRLRPITLVDDGGDVLLGDPQTGTFVAIPQVGAVVVRALQRGEPIDTAAAEAERHAGEPVDVGSFVDALRELGFVDEGAGDNAVPRPTAPVQQGRWVRGPLRERHARLLFAPAAWACYVGAFCFCVAAFAVWPGLWPRSGDVFFVGDNAGSAILAILLSYALVCVHEAWHWLAARALGLSARFGIDRRLYFLVFETDLSQLWSVPRRKRYGPQLAGLAIDSVMLAALLIAELTTGSGFVAALIYLKVMTMLWQCMVFLRTDLYGVLVTATGCRNLWSVKSLLLRRAFGRLSARQAAELDTADPRDVRVGLVFRWVYLAGFLVAVAYFGYFMVPVIITLLVWSAHGLAVGPGQVRFWLTAAGSAVLYLPLAGAAAIWLATRLRRQTGRTARR